MYEMKQYVPEGFAEGHMAAVSIIDGGYIGREELAKRLTQEYGIAPQKASDKHNVCSIGFCEKEQKWYGWSHRAIYGFGVGSRVEKGDCAYVPADWQDLIDKAISFWTEDGHLEVNARRSTDDQGKDCVKVQWLYASDPELVPNTKLHGTTRTIATYPPEEWGRGEWTAETLDDAKQMAIDFAEGVS